MSYLHLQTLDQHLASIEVATSEESFYYIKYLDFQLVCNKSWIVLLTREKKVGETAYIGE